MSLSRTSRAATAALALIVSASSLTAQQPSVAIDTTQRHQTLFTLDDAALAAGFAGLTVAMFPADKYIAHHLRDQTRPPNKLIDKTGTVFETISSPGAFVIGPALYAYGRFTHHSNIEDIGWHGTEAVVLATGVTGLLKGVLGRSRPYVTQDSNPHDFKFMKGFTGEDRSSFPSGHATTSFAAAAAVTSEVQRIWPKYTWIVGPVLYGGAAANALARVYHDKHWTSDVVMGAAIGTFSGLKVVRYSHQHPDNRLDSIMLHTSVYPDGHGGGALALTLPAP